MITRSNNNRAPTCELPAVAPLVRALALDVVVRLGGGVRSTYIMQTVLVYAYTRIHIHTCVCVYMCIHVYIYIYI